MKLNKEFAIREIDGDFILVPVGESALAFNGMMTTNRVGAFICEALKQDCTRGSLIRQLMDAFEAEEAVITADLDSFLSRLRELNLLEE